MKVFEYKEGSDALEVIIVKDKFSFYVINKHESSVGEIPTPQAVRLAYAILESVGAR